MNKNVEQFVDQFRRNATKYARNERYYNGDHDLKFATEKFENTFGSLFREFALNLCPVVCDAVRDKLQVTGFSVDAGEEKIGSGTDNSANSATRKIWHRNRMPIRAAALHNEVLKNGDAFAIVWPDNDGRAVIYPNRAASIAVNYDDERPGQIHSAAKLWLDDTKHIRLNLFFVDRIEKYISKNPSEGAIPEATGFVPFGETLRKTEVSMIENVENAGSIADGSHFSLSVVPNPFGVVPVFHFANNSDIGEFGRSELNAAIPIQDGLNKSVLDMLVAMEFSAFRQRWAAGIEVEYNSAGKAVSPFQSGIDSIWVTGDANAKFGDFAAADLEQFLKVKDSFRVDIATVTGTPLHYFIQDNSGFPSGESLRQASARFIAKVRSRQQSFGQTWSDLMAFAMRIEGHGELDLITQWEDPSPLSEREQLENILLKKQIGLPMRDALVEAGYGETDSNEMTNGGN